MLGLDYLHFGSLTTTTLLYHIFIISRLGVRLLGWVKDYPIIIIISIITISYFLFL